MENVTYFIHSNKHIRLVIYVIKGWMQEINENMRILGLFCCLQILSVTREIRPFKALLFKALRPKATIKILRRTKDEKLITVVLCLLLI